MGGRATEASELTMNGAVAWLAIDSRERSSQWIERRWISDNVTELWG